MRDTGATGLGVLRGRVCNAGDRCLVRVAVVVGDQTHRVEHTGEFAIEVDGVVVRVRPSGVTALLPERRERGAFGELLDDPLAAHALDHAPGDHVTTELRGNAVAEGDEVAVYGAIERAPAGGGGYREMPQTVPRSIGAEVVAIGDDGHEQIDRWLAEQRKRAKQDAAQAATRTKQKKAKPKPRDEPPPALTKPSLTPVWVFAGISAVALAAVLSTARTYTQGAGAAFAWSIALISAATAIFIWRRRRWFPLFRRIGDLSRGKRFHWGFLGAVVLVITGEIIVASSTAVAPPLGMYLLAGLVLPYIVVIVYRERHFTRTARSLLRARPLAPDLPDKQFGSVEGRLEGSLDCKRKHKTKTTTYGDSTRSTVTWQETWKVGQTSIITDTATIALSLEGASWAGRSHLEYLTEPTASMKLTMNALPESHRKRWRKLMLRSDPTLRMIAHPGDSVLAAGRVRRDDGVEFRATGPGSLLLFTSPAGTSARATLRRELWAHYLGVGALLAIAGVAIWVAQWWFEV